MTTKNSKETRKYGLSKEEITTLQAEYKSTKKIPNPHRGNYGAIMSALMNLGADKFHSYSEFEARVEKEMTREGWKAFEAKKPRNKNGKADASDRLLQNVRVLQRTKDYGKKILELGKVIKSAGVVIDLTREGDSLKIRLNTNSAQPMTPGRSPKSETAQKSAKSPAKPQKKAGQAPAKSVKAPAKAPILSGREAIAALKSMKKAK